MPGLRPADAWLRLQHVEFERHGQFAHNRRPVLATVAKLRTRARRRWWHRIVGTWTD